LSSPTPPPPIFIKKEAAVVLLGLGSQDEIQGLGESTVYNKVGMLSLVCRCGSILDADETGGNEGKIANNTKLSVERAKEGPKHMKIALN